MLSHPVHHTQPFPFFRCGGAFSPEECAALDGLFSLDGHWQHRDGAFYACSIRDVTADAPTKLLRDVAFRMREITGIPLSDTVQLTAQKMMPGQSVGVHSDRPLLGYEIARLVVQFNPDWQPSHGGVLELFEAPDGSPTERLEPGHNEAFGFVLHPESHHAVTEVTRPRRSVVFNFWHPANSLELGETLRTLFADVHFSALPSALDPVASSSEAMLSEDVTFRASMAATALQRWGYDVPTVVAGYQFSAGLGGGEKLGDEARAAIHLADWVAGLYRGAFDLTAWCALRTTFAGTEPYSRLQPLWSLCLP